MSALWRKEIRLVLPAFFVALVLPLTALSWWPRPGSQSWAVLLASLGCALLGGISFGPEFSYGTLAQLLAQPCDRRRLWRMKMTVLGCALAPFLGGMIVLHLHELGAPPGLYGFIPLCAFCAAPALTLRARNGLAGALLAFGFPTLLCGLVVAVVSWVCRVPLEEGDSRLDRALAWVTFGVLSTYCITMYWLGRRAFCRFEAVESLRSDLSVGRWFEAPFAWLARVFGRTGPWGALVRKELHLQRAGYLVAACLAAVILVVLALLPWLKPEHRVLSLHLPAGLLAGLIPLVLGTTSVAEERNLGVHAWQLTLPVPAWKHWLVKLVVTLGGSFALGLVLPVLALLAGHERDSAVGLEGSLTFWSLLTPVLTQASLTLLAMFASSLSGTTMKAVLGCFALLFALGQSYYWIGGLVMSWVVRSELEPADFLRFQQTYVGLPILSFWILLLSLLSFGNFKLEQLSRRRVCGQTLFLLGPGVVLSIVVPAAVALLVWLLLGLLNWR